MLIMAGNQQSARVVTNQIDELVRTPAETTIGHAAYTWYVPMS